MELIYNYDNLRESDITETIIRVKALIINNDVILLGNENGVLQFPGGHLEDDESYEECLKREVREETGIEISDDEIGKQLMKVTYFNRDWPEVGKNRKSEIYYYVVKTNKKIDMTNVNYTEREKLNNYKIEEVPLESSIDVIKNNIFNNDKNKVIAFDMIMAIELLSYNEIK